GGQFPSFRGDIPTEALGDLAVALGAGSGATGDGSTALGTLSFASAEDSTAIGIGAFADADNAVALGAGSEADRADSVSVGSACEERQITNVADGTEDTDAENLAQLDEVAGSVTELADDAVQYDDDGKGTVSLAGADGTVITNLAAGELSEDSTEAVNGSQLFETNTRVGVVEGRVDDLEEQVDATR